MNYSLQQLKKPNLTKNKKPPIDNRTSRNIYEGSGEKQSANKSFNEKKKSVPKLNALLSELLEKRTNSQDQVFNRNTTPKS